MSLFKVNTSFYDKQPKRSFQIHLKIGYLVKAAHLSYPNYSPFGEARVANQVSAKATFF